jgi:hypothetical protein
MKLTTSVLLVGITVLPVALVATFLLLPFWRWIERVSGVESIGHSGPAAWCFVVTYGGISAAVLLARFWLRCRRGTLLVQGAHEAAQRGVTAL